MIEGPSDTLHFYNLCFNCPGERVPTEHMSSQSFVNRSKVCPKSARQPWIVLQGAPKTVGRGGGGGGGKIFQKSLKITV